jgi:hypothetical protein
LPEKATATRELSGRTGNSIICTYAMVAGIICACARITCACAKGHRDHLLRRNIFN